MEDKENPDGEVVPSAKDIEEIVEESTDEIIEENE